jgi:3-methyladenine DNA glycosylase Tag
MLPSVHDNGTGEVRGRKMTREQFENELRDAGFKFDGHVTQGSFQAQLAVVDAYIRYCVIQEYNGRVPE